LRRATAFRRTCPSSAMSLKIDEAALAADLKP